MDDPPNPSLQPRERRESASNRNEDDWVETFRPKVARLLALCRGKHKALLLTHDNPDPDSLASAWALGQLLEDRAGMEVTLAYGGLIGGAEDRAQGRQLRIPALPLHPGHPNQFYL